MPWWKRRKQDASFSLGATPEEIEAAGLVDHSRARVEISAGLLAWSQMVLTRQRTEVIPSPEASTADIEAAGLIDHTRASVDVFQGPAMRRPLGRPAIS
jgi:hypothetical protein